MRIRFLSGPLSVSFKRSFASAVNRTWYRWRLWQHNNSRWILFWTLREIREHYRLWRMRPAILKLPKTLMEKQEHGWSQTNEMPSKAPVETYWSKDMWKKYSDGLALAHLTAEENMDRIKRESGCVECDGCAEQDEILRNQDSRL